MQSSYTKKLLEKYTAHYEAKLWQNESALTYLVNRGLTKETVTSFRLGLVEDIDPDSGHDFMIGRLAIPYITQTGIVQIRYKSIPKTGIPGDPIDSPKIMGEPGMKTTIYNAIDLLDSDTVCLCEGEPDTWSARQAGFNAIGIPGANAWLPLYAKILRYRKVIILTQNDDHGECMKMAKQIREDVRGSRIKLMPQGYDVNSFLIENGTDKLREFIDG